MTTIDYTRLRALAQAATPGPWHVVIDDDGNPLSGRPSVQASEEMDCAIVHWDGFVQEHWRSARGDKEIQANAAYIAAASPDVLLALLNERNRLAEQVAAMQADSRTDDNIQATMDREPQP